MVSPFSFTADLWKLTACFCFRSSWPRGWTTVFNLVTCLAASGFSPSACQTRPRSTLIMKHFFTPSSILGRQPKSCVLGFLQVRPELLCFLLPGLWLRLSGNTLPSWQTQSLTVFALLMCMPPSLDCWWAFSLSLSGLPGIEVLVSWTYRDK